MLSLLERLARLLTPPSPSNSPERQAQIFRLCQEAMKRGNMTMPAFNLLDIGLIAYRTPNHPKVVRTAPIMTDMRYLRPFAELSAMRGGTATIQFEIHDSHGKPHFVSRDVYTQSRRMRVVPKTWLPLSNLYAPAGKWMLLIWINEDLFAVHPFTWEALSDNEILNQLRTDGEITDDLKKVVKTGTFRPMSLDELLADQEE